METYILYSGQDVSGCQSLSVVNPTFGAANNL